MKKQWKGFLAGFLSAILITSLCVPVFAATVKQLSASYNDIKITLDGERLIPKDPNGNVIEPFIVDGTTYLPLRAVAEAVGLNVGWDGNTSTVILTSDGNQEQIPSVTPSDNYSRTNPAPIGTKQQVTVEHYWGSYTATVEIIDAFRGDLAWAKIKEANKYNPAPTSSMEYILAGIRITIDSVSVDRAIHVSDYDFTAFDSNNAEYERFATVNPKPELSGDIYEGGTLEGWVSFVVDTDDTSPKMVYGADTHGSGGIWFSLV